ncbi:MAG: hypothetical protein Q8936_03075 [Bacillota bacterium]|nr:hypothetical protein [Bacillota bacterium]
MNINKAIKKQNKAYKRFMLFMCFIFLILPSVFFISRSFKMFLIIYLIIIESLIIAVMLVRKNSEAFSYEVDGYRMKIRQGFPGRDFNISCDRVEIVHVEKREKDIEIVIITKSRFRNKKVRPINKEFFQIYPMVANRYVKSKRINPEVNYYYFVINHGGFKKYLFLNDLYRNCVNTTFTETAVEEIKYFRKNS